MFKALITAAIFSLTASASFALEAVANVSASTSSEDVEMEMTAEKQIIIRNAKPDAALYILSQGQAGLTPALVKAMSVVQEAEQASGLELAIKIFEAK